MNEMHHESEAARHLRDLQIAEGKRREAFGGSWSEELEHLRRETFNSRLRSTSDEPLSYEDWLGRVDAEMGNDGIDALIDRIDNPTFEDTFLGIFDEAYGLLIQRQRKYGPENITRQGMWGVITRIADDKIARIKRAFNGRIVSGQIALDPVAEGESDDTFEDACLDLMNYAAILLALKRGEWGRPLADELEAC